MSKTRKPKTREEQQALDRIGWFAVLAYACWKGEDEKEKTAHHELKLLGVTVHFQDDERTNTDDSKEA